MAIVLALGGRGALCCAVARSIANAAFVAEFASLCMIPIAKLQFGEDAARGIFVDPHACATVGARHKRPLLRLADRDHRFAPTPLTGYWQLLEKHRRLLTSTAEGAAGSPASQRAISAIYSPG
jgi:hypothetical protein